MVTLAHMGALLLIAWYAGRQGDAMTLINRRAAKPTILNLLGELGFNLVYLIAGLTAIFVGLTA